MAKIIFFSPHSFIWQHAFPEAVAAESLIMSGHEIVYVSCGEILSASCICLSMMGVHPGDKENKRKAICKLCRLREKMIRKEFKMPGYSLASFSESVDEKKIESIMAIISPENFTQLVIEDIPIGKIVTYELLLACKKITANFSKAEWIKYQAILRSSLKTFFILERIFEKEKPDYIISYNSLYSVNAVCTHLAASKNIHTYFMHAGMNLSDRFSNLMIGKISTLNYLVGLVVRWPKVKNITCKKNSLSEVTDHFLELLIGKNVFAYSAPKSRVDVDIRKYFGINTDQKILVATMSSYDEPFAAEFVGAYKRLENVLFENQADWIQALVEWLKTKPDYFLIIRVHPREFPNKRERIKSEHSQILQQKFSNLPRNVVVNWPEDEISLYDLACETDVFLNAWSSVGAEMALLGLPVVLYSRNWLLYPADINYLGETVTEYFNQIERAIKDGWSFERVRMAYRWYVMTYSGSQVRINGKKDIKNIHENKIMQKFYGGLRLLFPLMENRKDCKKGLKYLESAEIFNKIFLTGAEMAFDVMETNDEAPSLEQETKYIKKEMTRLAEALWKNKLQDKQRGKLYQQFKQYILY